MQGRGSAVATSYATSCASRACETAIGNASDVRKAMEDRADALTAA